MPLVNDYLNRVKTNGITLTKFLDETEISTLYQQHKNYHLYFEGGFSDAERKRAIISTDDVDIDWSSFEIAILLIKPLDSQNQITHRHVLGTILALGLNRNMIGDIIMGQDIYVFTTSQMSTYIKDNLTKINNTLVDVTIIEKQDFTYSSKEQETLINVSSFRLDAIIAKCLNISRNKAAELIEKGLVFINHIECQNCAKNVKEQDVISIRHFGRIEIGELSHLTKKNASS